MSIRVLSHLYRNRHGTFYFRLIIPKSLRAFVGKSEIRFSLQTEQRQKAIIYALPFIADLPRLVGGLQRMADNDESPPPDYFKLWREELFKSSARKAKIALLESDLEELRDCMTGMVSIEKAKQVGKIMHDKGQLQGKQELEQRLVFPWHPEKTKRFSELMAA